MSKNILGIDFGTSSVKLLLKAENTKKSKASYEEKTPNGWINALKKAFEALDVQKIDAIGLSSQVGTYIVNGKDVIGWENKAGKEELEMIKYDFSDDVFIKEIAMPHPDIISYPIPRLMYIKKHFRDIKSICQPKDIILKMLTGECVSDKYSWRGLANTKTGIYSNFFLDKIGIDAGVLPRLEKPESIAGQITGEGSKISGLPEGIPVYVGMNDFFSSIYGMDIEDEMFDITGTSEHIGILCDGLIRDTKIVSGVYFDKFIHYGVTASSGASLDFAINEFGIDGIDIMNTLKNNPPIFTPYLNGERAPVFDADARGVFFGINSKCTKKDMAYSVFEGVVFSLYHIYENIGCPKINSIKVSGGAAKNAVLNALKAELFNKTVFVLEENDTSALGAAKLAGSDAVNNAIAEIKPADMFRPVLMKRFNIYKNLYYSLKPQFKEFAKKEGNV